MTIKLTPDPNEERTNGPLHFSAKASDDNEKQESLPDRALTQVLILAVIVGAVYLFQAFMDWTWAPMSWQTFRGTVVLCAYVMFVGQAFKTPFVQLVWLLLPVLAGIMWNLP